MSTPESKGFVPEGDFVSKELLESKSKPERHSPLSTAAEAGIENNSELISELENCVEMFNKTFRDLSQVIERSDTSAMLTLVISELVYAYKTLVTRLNGMPSSIQHRLLKSRIQGIETIQIYEEMRGRMEGVIGILEKQIEMGYASNQKKEQVGYLKDSLRITLQ